MDDRERDRVRHFTSCPMCNQTVARAARAPQAGSAEDHEPEWDRHGDGCDCPRCTPDDEPLPNNPRAPADSEGATDDARNGVLGAWKILDPDDPSPAMVYLRARMEAAGWYLPPDVHEATIQHDRARLRSQAQPVHDCDEWRLEGIGCARCNPIAQEILRGSQAQEGEFDDLKQLEARLRHPIQTDGGEAPHE